jgi:hypothetical protein
MTTPLAAVGAASTAAGTAGTAAKAVVPTQPVQRGHYQTVILMEFIACILLTAATPIASKKNPDGLSPYKGADMVKLGAITFLFFILAAVSSGGGGPARVAMWFGGLILIGDGMYEASNLAKDFALFTGGAGPAAAGVPAPGGGGGRAEPEEPS